MAYRGGGYGGGYRYSGSGYRSGLGQGNTNGHVYVRRLGFFTQSRVVQRITMQDKRMVTKKPGSWTISCPKVKDTKTFKRLANLHEEDLLNFRIRIEKDEKYDGDAYLTIKQGKFVKTYDVSSAFSETLDLHCFEPGHVRLTLKFTGGTNPVRIFVQWRV